MDGKCVMPFPKLNDPMNQFERFTIQQAQLDAGLDKLTLWIWIL